MFLLGALLGMFFLAGFVSCNVVQPAWDGLKGVTGAVVGEAEGVVGGAYGLAKDVTLSVADTAEGAVKGAYDVVTDPFVGGDAEGDTEF